MKVKDWFLDFGRGAALGTGILPGVSVGTVGIIVNVYDKLLNSISGLLKKFWVSFLALLPIALGTVISAVILLWGYSHLKDYAPFEIIALLAGLILGGLPIIVKEIPWKEIKGMRTWFAHQYLDMDATIIWDVAQEGIPPLKTFCEKYIAH